MWTAFATTCVTSSMFVTALAPNLLAVALMRDIAKVSVSWTDWFLGFLPVGLTLFALQPLLIYRVCAPTVKTSPDVPRWAHREVGKMGPPTYREAMMAFLAVLALLLWIGGGRWVNATTVALLAFGLMPRVVGWDDVLAYRRAWNSLVWFATLITLADGLGKIGFLSWFATTTAAALASFSPVAQVSLLVAVFFLSHYMFASLTAHATTLLPVMLTSAVAIPGIPVSALSLVLSYSLGLMGILTPYATGSAPLYYTSGYLGRREFWGLGVLFGGIYLLALLGLGLLFLLAPWLRS